MSATGGAEAARRVVIRDGTPEDVERSDSLTEDDFAADLASVQIPNKEGPMSDGEMKVAVDSLLDSLKREREGDRGR
jgi:hypothetical protein